MRSFLGILETSNRESAKTREELRRTVDILKELIKQFLRQQPSASEGFEH